MVACNEAQRPYPEKVLNSAVSDLITITFRTSALLPKFSRVYVVQPPPPFIYGLLRTQVASRSCNYQQVSLPIELDFEAATVGTSLPIAVSKINFATLGSHARLTMHPTKAGEVLQVYLQIHN